MALQQRRRREFERAIAGIRMVHEFEIAALEARIRELEACGGLADIFSKMGGIAGHVADILREAGFDTVEKLQAATDAELEAVNGISKKRIRAIRKLVG
jgi:DNA integrity scanning protein DisA with diadenylate cyclase activity